MLDQKRKRPSPGYALLRQAQDERQWARAAHMFCTNLRPHLKRHHLPPGVGHYGVFSGSRWERQIYPQVRNLVLAMA